MAIFKVNGGKTLKGEISVSGSKNAALPLIFSALSVNGVSVFSSVPDIRDVRVAVEILSLFGVKAERAGEKLLLDARDVRYARVPEELSSKIRASSYLMGACLARFGKAEISPFGGCNFEKRPIDMHLAALKAMGAEVHGTDIFVKESRPADIYFEKPSVGATINALIFASSIGGVSRIFGYAKEPHVFALVDFLRRAGVKIEKRHSFIAVRGGRTHSAEFSVIPDMIEAGTYILASLICSSPFLIKNAEPLHLGALIEALGGAGAEIRLTEEGILPLGTIKRPLHIVTEPYPGFPTDLQPQSAPLMALAEGGTIKECVWRGRFGYLDELSSFGVEYGRSGDFAEIYKSRLHAADAEAPDLRGGAALLLAALAAEGESKISSSEIIDRGYENIVEKLRALGAEISIVQE